jgi:hypothetical protein
VVARLGRRHTEHENNQDKQSALHNISPKLKELNSHLES